MCGGSGERPELKASPPDGTGCCGRDAVAWPALRSDGAAALGCWPAALPAAAVLLSLDAHALPD